MEGGGGVPPKSEPCPRHGSEQVCSQSSLLSGSVVTVAAFISRSGTRTHFPPTAGGGGGQDKRMTSEQMHRGSLQPDFPA